ncbi:MAG: hypothetical protein Alpg2KO_24970 [Alphaproteobacteria bacterium]
MRIVHAVSHSSDEMGFVVATATVARFNSGGSFLIGTSTNRGRLTVSEDASGDPAADARCTHASFTGTVVDIATTRAADAGFNLIRARANAGGGADDKFIVDGVGDATCDGSFTGGGADYAEPFEWTDGNASKQDRIGLPVIMENGKVRVATSDDDSAQIIGVVTATPTLIGDAAPLSWQGRFLKDDYGRYELETVDVVEWEDEDGKLHSYAVDTIPDGLSAPEAAERRQITRQKLNPIWDPKQPYVPRLKRDEWDAIGLLGKLRLKADSPVNPAWRKLRDISGEVEEWLVL